MVSRLGDEMSVKESLVRWLAKKYKMADSYDFIDSMGKVGTESDVPMPTDLLPMAARMFTRGLYTQMSVQPNLDWVLPYWLVRQCDPADDSFVPRMTWSQFNLTHRNWTAVGEPGSDREVVIDPRGWVTPWFEGWSVDFWVELGGEVLFPSHESTCKQKHIENIPLVKTSFAKDDFLLELEAFVATASRLERVMMRARISNRTGETINPRLFVSVRPFNPEGASLVKSISTLDENTLSINGSLGLQFAQTPNRIFCSNGRNGDCAFFLNEEKPVSASECPAGLATAYAVFPLTIEPKQSAEVIASATVRPEKPNVKKTKNMRRYDYEDGRADVQAVWREKLQRGMSIDLPDKALTSSFDLCKSHLMLADDGDCITPGPMTYHHYWFRDSAYMVTALDRLGLHDRAEQKLLSYPKRQNSDGFFLSQPGEWDSAGQAIWTLAEHYRITKDRRFLEKMYESMEKGADWVVRTRKKASAAGPAKGLLPAGFSAEHFGPNDIYYWDNFWGLAGLRAVTELAEELSLRNDLLKYERESDRYLADILASLSAVEKRLGKPTIPAGPFRRFDSGAIGSVASLYPLRLLDPFDPLVENTLEMLHENCMWENGFFQQMIHSGINCYLTLHIAHCHVFRRETRAWPLIKYILALSTSTGTWPEAIHPKTLGGCMGDGMHMWAAADWLLILRDLLLFEDGENLVITPAPLENWFAWGGRVEVRNAPTYFGPVSYTIEGHEAEVKLNLDADWRKTPLKIEFNLPFYAEVAEVDGRQTNVNDTRLFVPGGARRIRVRRV